MSLLQDCHHMLIGRYCMFPLVHGPINPNRSSHCDRFLCGLHREIRDGTLCERCRSVCHLVGKATSAMRDGDQKIRDDAEVEEERR
jgi:hypothetical protein